MLPWYVGVKIVSTDTPHQCKFFLLFFNFVAYRCTAINGKLSLPGHLRANCLVTATDESESGCTIGNRDLLLPESGHSLATDRN